VENVTGGMAECPRQLHIDLGVGIKERVGRVRGKLYSYWPLCSYWPPPDYCHWGTNFVVHFHLGDFNNNEDKVFTFAAGAAIIVYCSGGSHSQKWLYDNRQILRPPPSRPRRATINNVFAN